VHQWQTSPVSHSVLPPLLGIKSLLAGFSITAVDWGWHGGRTDLSLLSSPSTHAGGQSVTLIGLGPFFIFFSHSECAWINTVSTVSNKNTSSVRLKERDLFGAHTREMFRVRVSFRHSWTQEPSCCFQDLTFRADTVSPAGFQIPWNPTECPVGGVFAWAQCGSHGHCCQARELSDWFDLSQVHAHLWRPRMGREQSRKNVELTGGPIWPLTVPPFLASIH
jgi:hypothetical protein